MDPRYWIIAKREGGIEYYLTSGDWWTVDRGGALLFTKEEAERVSRGSLATTPTCSHPQSSSTCTTEARSDVHRSGLSRLLELFIILDPCFLIDGGRSWDGRGVSKIF